MAVQLEDLDRLPQLAYYTIERNESISQQELCERLNVTRQALHPALDTLECHDMVRVERSTRDARQKVYTTD